MHTSIEACKGFLGRHFAAISDYDIAIRLEPDAADAYYNRGVAKVNLTTHAAIADYDIAIRLKPDFVQAYNNRGLAKADLGQYSAAIADYDTAIRLKPDTAEAYLNRGLAKVKLGQYIAAITILTSQYASNLMMPRHTSIEALQILTKTDFGGEARF